MDADLLRLILIALGGLLILGIYLWERRRRLGKQPPAAPDQRLEPTIGTRERDATAPLRYDDEDGELEQSIQELRDMMKDQPELQSDDDQEPPTEAALPTMILQVIVAAKNDWFEGPDIRRVTEGLGLRPGEMQIYQRRDGQDPRSPVLFRMANMMEPGTFPFHAMDEFTTPGLVLFAQLPGPRDGMATFTELMLTAERLATQLGGELHDETHSVMTKQTMEHMRTQILEHRRKVQLAKSKHK
jgi:cell division protein ZipA